MLVQRTAVQPRHSLADFSASHLCDEVALELGGSSATAHVPVESLRWRALKQSHLAGYASQVVAQMSRHQWPGTCHSRGWEPELQRFGL